MSDEEAALHAAQTAERDAALDKIIGSTHARRLIVAGPGTGKTWAFKRAFSKVGDRGIALTFINALVRDMRANLPKTVDVKTFHRYSIGLLHKSHAGAFDLYPPLTQLQANDLVILGFDSLDRMALDRAFHDLDETNPVVQELLALSEYYSAVSWTEAVYRVVLYLRAHPGAIPAHDLVCVDEYQDFSKLESELLSLLANVNRVLVAGDDDQALYGFKGASPAFFRAIATNGNYERHELPYCSRCTEVVVRAVNRVTAAAKTKGLLAGRLDKPFKCFLPAKAKDSKAHPKIIHANCSNQVKGIELHGPIRCPGDQEHSSRGRRRIRQGGVSNCSCDREEAVLAAGSRCCEGRVRRCTGWWFSDSRG